MTSDSKFPAAVGLAFSTALLALAISGSPTTAANAKENYCLNPASGGSSCGFVSMEQCRETMIGRNGWCTKAVDFGASAAGDPVDSFAYAPRGGRIGAAEERRAREEQDLDELHKKDMPVKGVGAE